MMVVLFSRIEMMAAEDDDDRLSKQQMYFSLLPVLSQTMVSPSFTTSFLPGLEETGKVRPPPRLQAS